MCVCVCVCVCDATSNLAGVAANLILFATTSPEEKEKKYLELPKRALTNEPLIDISQLNRDITRNRKKRKRSRNVVAYLTAASSGKQASSSLFVPPLPDSVPIKTKRHNGLENEILRTGIDARSNYSS